MCHTCMLNVQIWGPRTMRKLTVTTLGLALTCLIAFAVKAHADPVTTTSGELPRHAGYLWGQVKTQDDSSAANCPILVRTVVNDTLGKPVVAGQTNEKGE